MATSLKDKMARLPAARRAKIEAETARLQADYLTLQDLRKARELTQVRMAELLGKSQVTIAQLEKRSDVLLSTLRSYVEAMGGKLDLVVQFPDRRPVVLDGLTQGDTDPAKGGSAKEGKVGPTVVSSA